MINRQFAHSTELESEYWREVIQRVINAVVLLSTRGLVLRGHDEIIGSFHNANFLGILGLLSKYDPFLATHIEKYGNKGHESKS